MADPAPTQRRAPVGYRFRPTEEELVAYHLRHKLLADDPSIYTSIPEIDVCKQEPWDLLAWAVSAFPEIDPDDLECYFFSPLDYKYSNSTRRNRTTSLGYWKVTGRERKIRDRDTKNVIGIKKNLVFYRGRFPHGIKDNWVIHEYLNTMIPQEQKTYVLCRLMKKYEKKTKEKVIDKHELIYAEKESNNRIDFEYENQANFDDVVSKESYLSNMGSMISISSQSEDIESITQIFSQPNEAINSRIEASYQLNEGINSIQTQLQAQSKEVIDSTIELLPHSNEVISPELYSTNTIGTPFDVDSEEFYNSLLLQLFPTMDEQGLLEMTAPSYMLY